MVRAKIAVNGYGTIGKSFLFEAEVSDQLMILIIGLVLTAIL